MKRFFVFLLLSTIYFGCATESVDQQPDTASYLPLSVGNSWTYYRARFVRGSIAEYDTLHVSIIAKQRVADDQGYLVLRESAYGKDSAWVTEKDGVILRRVSMEWMPELDLKSAKPKGRFLHILSNVTSHQETYREIADSTFELNGKKYAVKRLHQQSILFDSQDQEVLRINFNQSFASGVGPVEVAFIDDPSQCQSCSLVSEFWTYRLIDFHLSDES